jgi:hypothetical protein
MALIRENPEIPPLTSIAADDPFDRSVFHGMSDP